MSTSHKSDNSDDGLDKAFAEMFNDPLPAEQSTAAESNLTDAVAPSRAAKRARSQTSDEAHSSPPTQKIDAHSRGVSGEISKNPDSKAVRDIANAAALRQSCTRLRDFDVERVPQSPPKVGVPTRIQATVAKPPPLPRSIEPSGSRSSGVHADDWSPLVRYEDLKDTDAITRALERVSPATWKVVGAILLALLLFVLVRYGPLLFNAMSESFELIKWARS